jgi:hypothetical protein
MDIYRPIYFISGPVDITQNEFEQYYKHQIEKACITPYAKFVIGDSNGVDKMAQEMLYFYGCDHNVVTIYYVKTKPFSDPKNNIGNWPAKPFKNHNERNAAITRDSTEDIL